MSDLPHILKLPADAEDIRALLKRPQMYVYDRRVSLFDNTLALLFGSRLTAKRHNIDDLTVKRWEDFEWWLGTKYENQPLWATFRAQFSSDAEAMDGLRAAYAEYCTTLS